MQNAITLRPYRVMTSQIQRLKSKSACFERNAAEKSDENQPPGQPQPASTGPESTVSATAASTSTTSARDQSHLRQHHNGHSQWSARPHPAPQESESTTGSITKGKPSLLVRTQALPASSDKNSGAANHERQSALKYFSSTEAHQKSTN